MGIKAICSMESLIRMIIFAGCVQGIFLSVLVFASKKAISIKLPLGLLLLAFSINLAHTNSIVSLFQFLPQSVGFRLIEPTQMLFGPLLFIFCRNLISSGKPFRLIDSLHALPFIFAILINLLIYKQTGIEIHCLHISGIMFQRYFILIIIVQIFVYLAFCHQMFSKHKHLLKDEYANDPFSDIAWLGAIMCGISICYAANIPLLIWLLHGGPDILNEVLSLITALFVFAIGYRALLSGMNYRKVIEKETGRYTNSPLDKATSNKLYECLCEKMKANRLFTDAELTLHSLAEQMGIAPYQLSQVINENSKGNFFEFVNSYRVEEVKRLITQTQMNKRTMLDIAFDAGFNSKPTFNKVFKELTGLTPTRYSSLQKK